LATNPVIAPKIAPNRHANPHWALAPQGRWQVNLGPSSPHEFRRRSPMPQRVIPQIASGHGVLWPGIRVELSVASTFFRPPSSSLQQWLAFRDAHRSLEEPAVKGGWPHVRSAERAQRQPALAAQVEGERALEPPARERPSPHPLLTAAHACVCRATFTDEGHTLPQRPRSWRMPVSCRSGFGVRCSDVNSNPFAPDPSVSPCHALSTLNRRPAPPCTRRPPPLAACQTVRDRVLLRPPLARRYSRDPWSPEAKNGSACASRRERTDRPDFAVPRAWRRVRSPARELMSRARVDPGRRASPSRAPSLRGPTASGGQPTSAGARAAATSRRPPKPLPPRYAAPPNHPPTAPDLSVVCASLAGCGALFCGLLGASRVSPEPPWPGASSGVRGAPWSGRAGARGPRDVLLPCGPGVRPEATFRSRVPRGRCESVLLGESYALLTPCE
jgi:hypothetical protein